MYGIGVGEEVVSEIARLHMCFASTPVSPVCSVNGIVVSWLRGCSQSAGTTLIRNDTAMFRSLSTVSCCVSFFLLYFSSVYKSLLYFVSSTLT